MGISMVIPKIDITGDDNYSTRTIVTNQVIDYLNGIGGTLEKAIEKGIKLTNEDCNAKEFADMVIMCYYGICREHLGNSREARLKKLYHTFRDNHEDAYSQIPLLNDMPQWNSGM